MAAATTTMMQQLPQNLDDELAELDKRLHAAERLLERRQIPPSTPIQPATITPTINIVNNEDASITNVGAATTANTSNNPTIVANSNSSPLLPDDASIINLGATIAANSSGGTLQSDAAKPLLLAAPRRDQATNNVAVTLLSSNFTTKLMDNDAPRAAATSTRSLIIGRSLRSSSLPKFPLLQRTHLSRNSPLRR
jgi:hypothetical protein